MAIVTVDTACEAPTIHGENLKTWVGKIGLGGLLTLGKTSNFRTFKCFFIIIHSNFGLKLYSLELKNEMAD